VPNGKAPKGEFKTWKKVKEPKEGDSFKERRAKRIAAHQASVASKSRVRDDGERWMDAHQLFTTGEEAIVDDSEANTETTWEDISYDAVREAVARQMLESEQNLVDPDTKEKYQSETVAHWNSFYGTNKQNFFKDRNYLGRAFPELAPKDNSGEIASSESTKRVLMEVGSGVGNTVLPLIELHPNDYFYAFDCSQNAIELLKSHEKYLEGRAHAFVCDITREAISSSDVADGSVDIVTMIFMLSAVPPELMDIVVQRISKKMKMGGVVLFRDYGVYDMTQMRFYAKKTLNKLGENFYRRSDGTFTYFFSLDFLEQLFRRNGFEVVFNSFDTRVLSNRKRKIRMYRVWAHSKFIKVAEPSDLPVAAPSGSHSS
jgi:methyltransferase-like protein 6